MNVKVGVASRTWQLRLLVNALLFWFAGIGVTTSQEQLAEARQIKCVSKIPDDAASADPFQDGEADNAPRSFDFDDAEKINTARTTGVLQLDKLELTITVLKEVVGVHNVKRLELLHCRIAKGGLAYLSALKNLEWLDLMGTNLTAESLENLPTSIRTLGLAYTDVNDCGVRSLVRLTQLESLDLQDAAISDASLPSIGKLNRLKSLDLYNTDVSGKNLEVLKPLVNLTRLSLGKQRQRSLHEGLGRWFDFPPPRIALRGMPRLENLEYLGLAFCELDPPNLRFVAQVPCLRELDLRNVNVSNSSLDVLPQLKKLDELNLSDTGISDPGLRYVVKCKTLRSLDLSRTSVSSKSPTILSQLLHLRSLSLSGTLVGDDNVTALKGCTELRALYLMDTHVSKAKLDLLPHVCPRLNKLWYGPQLDPLTILPEKGRLFDFSEKPGGPTVP